MPSFCLGLLFGRGQTRALADSAPPHAPIEAHRLRAIGLGVDSMQDDQGAMKPRSCTGWQEVGP
jgi:hypothetical protein